MLRGSRVEPLTGAEGIAVDGAGRVLFVEAFAGDGIEPARRRDGRAHARPGGRAAGGIAPSSTCSRGEAHGETGGVLCDSVREFCRKRGIRFAPGPWRYSGGLV